MLKLIPAVKQLNLYEGNWDRTAVALKTKEVDERLLIAINDLESSENGIPLEIHLGEGALEEYKLKINEAGICIIAGSEAGAFYAIQTLKQIFANGQIPYLEIQDKPDFEHRGFYHDITRGKVPTVETMKQFIDQMAYYKLNSLQLYVEHVYEFKECKALNEELGYFTKEEMQELDEYCKERFIDFIPSLSTFGHLYEMLELDEYKHLRAWKDFVPCENRWHERMAHHTLNPLMPESEEVVKSLIDQFVPAFTSETFNICCDETFDLNMLGSEVEAGKMYVDFTKMIIEYVESKGKKVMMWADVLVEHPECINDIPEDIVFLNWDYEPNPPEEKVRKFSELGRKQIICPGTGTWRRLCEHVSVEEQNISKMAEYAHKYHALGILNTNWGDWGN
ncbi:MAG: family 20 glycosylhydrolase, partial [Lachnospiraceae bacterium]|nr:family 20 glycosylhydrolase [Lachnospiraceae bacterium]